MKNTLFFMGVVMAAVAACAVSPLEKKLSPEHAEFLSKVRYIISREERNAFLRLPDSEKPRFIEEFWKRRDPDPYTEENEFKEEYFGRMKRADELFLGEGKPGWLTDRGRIYILFGPPSERTTSPASAAFYGRCQEVWYYGDFPVVFIDANCNGNFVLATLDLSRLNDFNLARAGAQKAWMQQPRRAFIDFSLSMKKKTGAGERFEGAVVIEIPYRTIWLSAEGDKLKTTLEITAEIKDNEGALLWEFRESYELVLTREELAGYQNKAYTAEIPFALEKMTQAPREGKSKLEVILRNSTGKEEVRKTAEFSL